MKQSFIFLAAVASLVVFTQCKHRPEPQLSDKVVVDTVVSETTPFEETARTFLYATAPSGMRRSFCVIAVRNIDDDPYTSFFHYYGVRDEDADTVICVPSFDYDRYDDGHNWQGQLLMGKPHYALSPDLDAVFVVTCVFANSDGWVREYQLFRLDCASLDVELLGDYAGIRIEPEGPVCSVARLTNKDALCTADRIWVMHDVRLDWQGCQLSVDSEEYDYYELERRYATSEEFVLLPGFRRVYE